MNEKPGEKIPIVIQFMEGIICDCIGFARSVKIASRQISNTRILIFEIEKR
ncbi:hypothetical protein [Flexilinea flocculi]|jgi:hypothetical protein|uniref:hypothetical protein n=1 Tax=Flexilinea flocculi TaxID=1678840 RepID=UPI00155DCADE|nr:hypothetical protein [Flexilinea flocculi]